MPKGESMEDQGQKVIDAVLSMIEAQNKLTNSINALVESNQRLMMILAEGMQDGPEESMITYLDGTPK